MTAAWPRLLAALVLLLVLPAARSAITCTIGSPGISINYVNNSTASVQTYFSVSCTRTSTSDPATVNYDVLADNGMYFTGQNNRAALGTSYLRYDVFTSAACNTAWKGNRKISDSISWPAGATGTITRQTSYWACIVTAQVAPSTGTYTDSVRLDMTYGQTNAVATGSAPVSIYAPAFCSMTSAAGNLSLAYAAFGPPVSTSTSFAVTCTSGMPYTLTTDVPESVITGLRYTLGVSASTATGTGAPQSYAITATIPGGQAGDCPTGSCTATQTHTLTITY